MMCIDFCAHFLIFVGIKLNTRTDYRLTSFNDDQLYAWAIDFAPIVCLLFLMHLCFAVFAVHGLFGLHLRKTQAVRP